MHRKDPKKKKNSKFSKSPFSLSKTHSNPPHTKKVIFSLHLDLSLSIWTFLKLTIAPAPTILSLLNSPLHLHCLLLRPPLYLHKHSTFPKRTWLLRLRKDVQGLRLPQLCAITLRVLTVSGHHKSSPKVLGCICNHLPLVLIVFEIVHIWTIIGKGGFLVSSSTKTRGW